MLCAISRYPNSVTPCLRRALTPAPVPPGCGVAAPVGPDRAATAPGGRGVRQGRRLLHPKRHRRGTGALERLQQDAHRQKGGEAAVAVMLISGCGLLGVCCQAPACCFMSGMSYLSNGNIYVFSSQ